MKPNKTYVTNLISHLIYKKIFYLRPFSNIYTSYSLAILIYYIISIPL